MLFFKLYLIVYILHNSKSNFYNFASLEFYVSWYFQVFYYNFFSIISFLLYNKI